MMCIIGERWVRKTMPVVTRLSVIYPGSRWNYGKLRGTINEGRDNRGEHYRFSYSHSLFGNKHIKHQKRFYLDSFSTKRKALKAAKNHQKRFLLEVNALTNCYVLKEHYVKMTCGEPNGPHTPIDYGRKKFIFDLDDLDLVRQHFWYWDGQHMYTRLGQSSRKTFLPNYLCGPGKILYHSNGLDCRRSQFKVERCYTHRPIRPSWDGKKRAYLVRVRRRNMRLTKTFSESKYGSESRALRRAEKFIKELKEKGMI